MAPSVRRDTPGFSPEAITAALLFHIGEDNRAHFDATDLLLWNAARSCDDGEIAHVLSAKLPHRSRCSRGA